MTATLTTSLAEIRSFNPSAPRWKNALTARKPQCSADYTIQFSLVDYLESSSVADVCWLLGKRKKEIQICVRFAQMCADSVKDLNSKYAANANAYAANVTYAAAYAANVTYANAYAAAATYAANANAATYAANAATNAAAYAAAYAANAAAYAATYAANATYAAAYANQLKLNKQFLTQCINEYQS